MKRALIKQDINFLDKPLWFQNVRHDGLGFVWTDIEGYEYRTGYKLPDKVDMLILFYLMLKSQTSEYETILEVTRREILIGCGLPSRNNKYYTRVEDSLKRWASITLHFKGTFYDNRRYTSIIFHIMEDCEIDEETKKVTVRLNEKWMLKIKESSFFRYLNFEYYKLLKRPVSRRLYEILSPKCYDDREWSIHLAKLGTKLPIFKQTVHTKESKKEVMYASNVLKAIKPAINEINSLAKNPDITEKAQALPGDVFTIEYHITGERQDRVIHFKKHLVLKQEKSVKLETVECICESSSCLEQDILPEQSANSCQNEMVEALLDPVLEKKTAQELEKKEGALQGEQIKTLFDLLDTKSEDLELLVKKYYGEKGFDYVYWNIRYANLNAKTNYCVYLQKCLENNYAYDWAKEEKLKQQRSLEKEEEYQRRIDEQKKEEELRKLAKEQVSAFRQAADALDDKLKWKLWNQAENEIPENTCRPKMNIKIGYAERVLEHLNDQGSNFVRQVLNDFGMIFDIALKQERDR